MFIYQRVLTIYHWGGTTLFHPRFFGNEKYASETTMAATSGGSLRGGLGVGVRDVGCRIYDIFIMGYYKVVPQFVSVQLVQITPISLWFMADIIIVNGFFHGILVKSIYIWSNLYSCLIYLSDIFIMGYYIIYI